MCRPRQDLPNDPQTIVGRVLGHDRRVLLVGPPGVGKSTLAAHLADQVLGLGRSCHCLGADPGSPAFGIPGALALATRRRRGAWQTSALEPLCSLDAGRFRLPLIAAARRLAWRAGPGTLLIDGPGLVRGVGASELLHGLAEAAGVDLVLALAAGDRPLRLADDLAALAIECWRIPSDRAARRPGRRARARRRTALWDAYLGETPEQEVELVRLAIWGTPPPVDAADAWVGRQVALQDQAGAVVLAEVTRSAAGRLGIRAPASVRAGGRLLVRDAQRDSQGLLGSATPFARAGPTYLPPPHLLPAGVTGPGPRPVTRVGAADVALVNGLFGDPLLHLRLRDRACSLLFDLGDGSRLAARVAHQVAAVFVSHAHMDHLAGFPWLLRSRIGRFPACRLFGPPGLAQHIHSLVSGFLWDRVGQAGPVFEVAELHPQGLHCFRLQVGRSDLQPIARSPVVEGIVHRAPGYRVRAVTLDHHTPVLAYAFEPEQQLHVQRDRLAQLGLPAGPWLGQLKRLLGEGAMDSRLALPDGRELAVAELAQLVTVTPGRRLVYATDLADTPANRSALVGLARNAHTLFLEAVFAESDAERARRHGHLTARACGEIAAAARVARLVPFHLSRRYDHAPERIFDEVEAAYGAVVRPMAVGGSGGV